MKACLQKENFENRCVCACDKSESPLLNPLATLTTYIHNFKKGIKQHIYIYAYIYTYTYKENKEETMLQSTHTQRERQRDSNKQKEWLVVK